MISLVDTVFKEITVLGFIGLFVYVMTHTGFCELWHWLASCVSQSKTTYLLQLAAFSSQNGKRKFRAIVGNYKFNSKA